MSELPIGWVLAPLGEIVDILDAQRIPINSEERGRRIKDKDESQLYRYYGATGQVGYIDDFLFDETLILLGEDGVPFFDSLKTKAYQVSGKYWVNNHAHVLRAIDNLANQDYISSFLNSFDYTGFVSGSTRLKLTQASMKSIPVALAPLNEQKRIADKLDRLLAKVDNCRERLDRIPLILKSFRRSVLNLAISGQLTEDWTNNEKWSYVTLGKLLSDIRYGTSKKSFYDGDTPVLRIPNIQNGHINIADLKYGQFDSKEIETLALKIDDILIIRSNGSVDLVGKAAIIAKENEGYLFAGYLIRLRLKKELILSMYLYLFLSSPSTRKYIELTARSTSGVNNINSEEIRAIEVPLPSLGEQQEIVRRVEKLFDFADRLEARYQTARAQIDKLTPALLAKAFQGELVPQDPTDEPAAALLAKIQRTSAMSKTTHRGKK